VLEAETRQADQGCAWGMAMVVDTSATTQAPERLLETRFRSRGQPGRCATLGGGLEQRHGTFPWQSPRGSLAPALAGNTVVLSPPTTPPHGPALRADASSRGFAGW